MALAPGTRLGPYEVVAPLGAGGMGEVYRARDARLGRDVALKVLPPDFASVPDRLARFEREARVVASLNHPNIATVHGLEEGGGVRALVMELVEGEDLAERIARGPIPLDEAIPIARQVAEAIEAAHDAGVVHRDLKPANVKVTPEGRVKVLDFGLAKAFEGACTASGASRADATASPTITSLGTIAGVILGTAAYMSPEQARGKPVDRRADIWAFGVLVFEMLTGRRLFDGETVSDTLAAVLRAETDLSALPAATPRALRALLARCLDRDPHTRLRDAGEARIVLSSPHAMIDAPHAAQARSSSSRGAALAAAAAILLAAAAFLAGRYLSRPAPAERAPAAAFDVSLGEGSVGLGSLAISPDGRTLAFLAGTSASAVEIWLRPLDDAAPHALPGSRGARFPFWSPDSREIAFFIGDNLLRAAMDGTAPRRIATVRAGLGGSWAPDGTILVGTEEGPLFAVNADGGAAPTAVTQLDEGVETCHAWPAFLPDGRRFVFMSDSSSLEGHRIRLGSLDGGTTSILISGLRSPALVDPRGSLLLAREAQLVAYPFDWRRGVISGDARLVKDGVVAIGTFHHLLATVSARGILAYQTHSGTTVLERIDLFGTSLRQIAGPGLMGDVVVSPDGRMIAYSESVGSEDRRIWVQDIERGVRTAVSEAGKLADDPAWSADGEAVYFDSNAGGSWQVYRTRVSGGGAPELIGAPAGDDLRFLDCSPDGRHLLAASLARPTSWDLFVLALEGDGASASWTSWLATPATEGFGRFSPDGRFIAYVSDASGRAEVFLAPVDGGPASRRWQISAGGGTSPAFGPDGRRIYFRGPEDDILSADLSFDGASPTAGAARTLFRMPIPLIGSNRNTFAPAPDGQSLIVARPETSGTLVIHVNTGWELPAHSSSTAR
jgi:Tol biopolymer transport system component